MIKKLAQPNLSEHPQREALYPAENPQLERTQSTISVTEPWLGPEEMAAIQTAVDSGFISSAGPAVEEFEAALASTCNTEHAIAVSSGTHGLDLLMYALGVGPGDEVIVPALTFISVGATIVRAGGRPIFVDVDRDRLVMSSDAVRAAITDKTVGIIPVHTYGHPCAMGELNDLADEHGLFVLEDTCEALGAQVQGAPVGGLGDVGIHSFYANKMITTGNGGALTTNHAELAKLLRELRGYSYSPGRFFWHEHMPFNIRMSALQAAVGTVQLQRLEEIVTQRQWLAIQYQLHLRDVPGITLPTDCATGRHAYWMYTIHVHPEEAGMDAADLRARLAENGIETRPVFTPLHVQPILQMSEPQGPFPNSEWAARTGINLPSAYGLSADQIKRICTVIRHCVTNS